jgi:hypothetical protein
MLKAIFGEIYPMEGNPLITDPVLIDEIFNREAERRKQALAILERLDLFKRWSRFGVPTLVGAVRYGLAVRRDIDMEVYAGDARIEHGFEVMAEVAQLPGIWKVRFSNELDSPDQGLYWGLRYRAEGVLDREGEIWKVDCWYLRNDHPWAHWGERFAEAMERVLTPETRCVILEIKEAIPGDEAPGIDIYRAVLKGGVRSPEEYRAWIAEHRMGRMQMWLPT